MAPSYLRRKSRFWQAKLLIIAVVFFAWGCATAPESPQPPVQDEQPISETDAPSVSLSPESDTPTVTMPAQQGALSSEGPWFVFVASQNLYAVNPDGSGLTQIAGQLVQPEDSWPAGVSPSGGHIAYITGQDGIHNLSLNLYSFASGEHRVITPLVSPEIEAELEAAPFERVEAVEAIVYYESLAWSPDGERLAFIAAIDGPSADVYLYDLQEDTILRLTSGPSQVYGLSWSPDGEYVMHFGVESFGTGAGYSMAGAWVANADGSGATSVYAPPDSGSETVLGWYDDQTVVVSSWDPGCGSKAIRAVDVESGAESSLWEGYFGEAAMDFESGSILLTLPGGVGECNPDGQQGLYLIVKSGSPFRFLEDEPYGVLWSPEAGLFFARTEFGVVAVSTQGDWNQLETLTGNYPASNPKDKSLAWPGDDGLWLSPLIVSLDGPQPEKVFDQRVLFAAWDPTGEYLFFMGEGAVHVLRYADKQITLVTDEGGGRAGAWVVP